MKQIVRNILKTQSSVKSDEKTTYETPEKISEDQRHILTILVDNEPGVLAKVIGMFSGRGYNIDSLNVAEVSNDENLSRITIVTGRA